MAPQDGPLLQHIVICCDGSWCGEATGTNTNIQIIANSIANRAKGAPVVWPARNPDGDTIVYYFAGVGEDGPHFADYLVDGALAVSIRKRCVDAYGAIVDYYRSDSPGSPGTRIWMFGLSRGAFTVRSVAGMINNLGVLHRDQPNLADLCDEVYSIYRNRDPAYSPTSVFAKHWRHEKSHNPPKHPPIRFVGLLDTVGALGVPKINPGLGLSYEFYDQVVSREVQTVCQALATHDRMSVFTPCFVRRSAKADYKREKFETEEVWFPGSHYDIGRQRFVLGLKGHGLEGLLERVQMKFNVLHTNITYTKDLANGPLCWLISKVKAAQPARDDGRGMLLDKSPEFYTTTEWAHDDQPTTSNGTKAAPWTKDAYDNMFDAAFGVAERFNLLPGVLDGVRSLVRDQLLADRNIPQSPVEPAAFYRASADREPAPDYDNYTSQSFQHFQRVSFRGTTWASVPPQGATREAQGGVLSPSG